MFFLGRLRAYSSRRDTPIFPHRAGVSRLRAIASTVAGGAAPGNSSEERSDFRLIIPTSWRHPVSEPFEDLGRQAPFEQLSGFSVDDLENLVAYLQLSAESGEIDPEIWNAAVRFTRRHSERWARILAG